MFNTRSEAQDKYINENCLASSLAGVPERSNGHGLGHLRKSCKTPCGLVPAKVQILSPAFQRNAPIFFPHLSRYAYLLLHNFI